MQIQTRRIPRARYLARAAKPMSRAARQRLRWMDHYRTHGRNAAFTCRQVPNRVRPRRGFSL